MVMKQQHVNVPRLHPLGWSVVILGMLHVALMAITGLGVKFDHILVPVLLFAAAWFPRTRMFTALSLPIWTVGIVFELKQLFDPFRPPPHVADLYHAELSLFGVPMADGSREVLPIVLQDYPVAIFDLIAGPAYLMHIFGPLLLALGLLWAGYRRAALAVTWGFCLVSILGFVIQFAYPAAPPWYITDYGLGPANHQALPSAAGALRFDALIGIDIFEQYYARNTNVFGAMPSLHTAVPVAAAMCTLRASRRWQVISVIYALIIALSAVYLGHHYILDVIAGGLLGLFGGCTVHYFLVDRPAASDRRAPRAPAPPRSELLEDQVHAS